MQTSAGSRLSGTFKRRTVLAIALLMSFSVPALQSQPCPQQAQFSHRGPDSIEPMTQVDEKQHTGYFGDPYPIHRAPWLAFLPQDFSGTTAELMSCKWSIRPGCFKTSPLTVTIPADFRTKANEAGNEYFDQINRNIYQTSDGQWNMAVTLYLRPQSAPKTTLEGTWTVIAHAHPDNEYSLETPSAWTVDKILVGSDATAAKANYDGKYFEDDGTLYLLYSKRETKTERDGIVAQPMESPKQVAKSDPTWLLAPSTNDGGFNSEYFAINWAAGGSNAGFKLIETGNITKIAGKYVMAYSTGDYQQLDYKTGIAFSDTLLPHPGEMYRRILQDDASGVWGAPGHPEVRYLLQSQIEKWPNYYGDQVLAPGVPSVVQGIDGQYLLYFDGFLPSDVCPAKHAPQTSFDPTYRRPFYVKLNVRVPWGKSVSAASPEDLANWITISNM